MALFGQAGSILKQSISQNSASAMLNSVRYMSTKLFIGGVSYSTDDNSLHAAFSQFGQVTSARIIVDRDTGRSRGFGFVEFADDESAQSALGAMDGQVLDGRNIRVSVANERQAAPGGGFGGGGGYQGGRGYGGGGNYQGGGGGSYQGCGGGGSYQRNSSYGGGNDEF
ncbi:glycine-rich RNA-binding protein 4, mitochondrial-like [Silene latifolia]|uniref:glycine-rich RNA-binding protein 4, mitochondrial-like n=1 Tax=Silene latifolia TaxID=37657 RepID=UPI003D7810FD